MKNYDIFVFELCDGNIAKVKNGPLWPILNENGEQFTLSQRVEICSQLIEGLQQLEKNNKCHNDLKPENILYKINDEDGDQKVSIKIGDFGTAERSGGTPGWTWPKFLSKREPGKSDMYSTGLLLLYVMCDSSQLFHLLRNNYITGCQQWVGQFRKDPLIELVIDMMGLKKSVQECVDRWNEISDYMEILSISSLSFEYKIPPYCFDIQDGMDLTQLKRYK